MTTAHTTQAVTPPLAKPTVLQVDNLQIHYKTAKGSVRAVNGVSFGLRAGETLGLVGESGCGKSTIAMGILRMVQNLGVIVGGRILLNDQDFLALNEEELRAVRWRDLALIPQGAMNSLNPTMTIDLQIADAIAAHTSLRLREARMRVPDLLQHVGLTAEVGRKYPHELSGGMKQRVCIAMAIALNPSLVIADEPTSALDVVTQRAVGETLKRIKETTGVSMILIGHDMGLQAQLADRIAVMYAGNLVELAPVNEIFAQPLHPYTRLLIEATPSVKERKPLKVVQGSLPDLRNPPPGCIFQSRCPAVMDVCHSKIPPLREITPDHLVACHLHDVDSYKKLLKV
jgi:peptide/nickel transport system ATP-binding protein